MGNTNVGTIYAGLELQDQEFKQVLQQSKAGMAKAALDMQRSSKIKFDKTEWKSLTGQMKALQERAKETRMALLKASAGSDEAMKLQRELRGVEQRLRVVKGAAEPARRELEKLARAERAAANEAKQLAQEKAASNGALMQKGTALVGTMGGPVGQIGQAAAFGGWDVALVSALVIAITAGAAAMAALGAAGVKLGSDLEIAEVAFEGLLGSAEKAHTFIGELRDFAAKTPFEMPGLLENTRLLMAFKFESEKILPILRVIGDAAAYFGGGTEQINRVVVALGQMKAKTKVSAQEMMQLTEAGIPAWDMLATKIGVSVPEAMKLSEKGAIDATTAINGILEGMNASYAGGMDKLSRTNQGIWSTIKDTARNALADVGRWWSDALKPAMLDTLNKFEQAWPKIKSAMADLWSQAKPWLKELWEEFKLLADQAKPLMKILAPVVISAIVSGLAAMTLWFKSLNAVLKNVNATMKPLIDAWNWISKKTGISVATKDSKSTPAAKPSGAAAESFLVSPTTGPSAADTAIITSVNNKTQELNRSLFLNGDASEYAAMQWAVLNGEYKNASDAQKRNLLNLAKEADLQSEARDIIKEHAEEQKKLAEEAKRTADQMAGHYAQKLTDTISNMRKWAGDMADAMKSFSSDTLDAVKDQLRKEQDERDKAADKAKSRYEKLSELGAAGAAAMTNIVMFGGKDKKNGLIEAGNVDLYNRPMVKNDDGSISTVNSMSFEENGKTVLVPGVNGNRQLTPDEAWQQYEQTGQHLGKFNSQQAADSYAERLHQEQDAMYTKFSERIGQAAEGVAAGRANEAAMRGLVDKQLYGDSIGKFEAASKAQTPDMTGASVGQQVTLLTQVVTKLDLQLRELVKMNGPMVTSRAGGQ